MERQFNRIQALGDAKDQVNQFNGLVNEVVASESLPSMQCFLNLICRENIHQQVSRPVMVHFVKSLSTISGELYEAIASSTIDAIKQSTYAFDEADYLVREGLFSYYVKLEQFKDAAIVLSAVDLNSQTRPITEDEKADLYVRCAGMLTLL